jgi:hypothetical protein
MLTLIRLNKSPFSAKFINNIKGLIIRVTAFMLIY